MRPRQPPLGRPVQEGPAPRGRARRVRGPHDPHALGPAPPLQVKVRLEPLRGPEPQRRRQERVHGARVRRRGQLVHQRDALPPRRSPRLRRLGPAGLVLERPGPLVRGCRVQRQQGRRPGAALDARADARRGPEVQVEAARRVLRGRGAAGAGAQRRLQRLVEAAAGLWRVSGLAAQGGEGRRGLSVPDGRGARPRKPRHRPRRQGPQGRSRRRHAQQRRGVFGFEGRKGRAGRDLRRGKHAGREGGRGAAQGPGGGRYVVFSFRLFF